MGDIQIEIDTPIVKYGKGRPKKGEIRPPKPPKNVKIGRPKVHTTDEDYKTAKRISNKSYYEGIRDLVKKAKENE